MPWNFTEEQLAAWQFCPACKYVPGPGTCCRCLGSLQRQEDAFVHPPSTRSCVCRTQDLGRVQCQQILSEADSRIDRHVCATVVCTSKAARKDIMSTPALLTQEGRSTHATHLPEPQNSQLTWQVLKRHYWHFFPFKNIARSPRHSW